MGIFVICYFNDFSLFHFVPKTALQKDLLCATQVLSMTRKTSTGLDKCPFPRVIITFVYTTRRQLPNLIHLQFTQIRCSEDRI